MSSPTASIEDKTGGGSDTEAKVALDYTNEASISKYSNLTDLAKRASQGIPLIPARPGSAGPYHEASENKRQIGVISATFLIFNRIIGTGIFATPSAILSLCGSVGLALFIWVVGMLIALAGMMVYLEFGTAIPKNGGEKLYLEFVYRRPKFLATAVLTGYIVLLGE